MPLDPARWTRVNELFEGALALQEGARATFLSAHAGEDVELRREVESLLEYAPILGDPLTTVIDDVLHDAAEGLNVLPLQRIGPYRVQSEIGTGGMGSVYLADRDGEDFQQRVALKLVRGFLSEQGLRRFRAERRILAALHHPSIARLLDGGSTDAGVPYLVMEYVDGLPIDQYCATRELTIRDRLALFCRVCEAVAYAHRQLVVHRDLKPSNILVTADGTPKLLDFGIAKLMDDDGTGSEALHTSPSMRLLTPDYASPEQIRGGAVTTGSDVYSLGVLLFELLTGERPHRFNGKALDAVAREVIDRDAPAPSSVASSNARLLRGDLDTITLAAAAERSAAALRHRRASRRGCGSVHRRASRSCPAGDVGLPHAAVCLSQPDRGRGRGHLRRDDRRNGRSTGAVRTASRAGARPCRAGHPLHDRAVSGHHAGNQPGQRGDGERHPRQGCRTCEP